MRRVLSLFASLSILFLAPVLSSQAQAYKVTNLLSDGSVPATTMDPSFLNPWGISVSPTWWISTANSGDNFVVNAATNAIVFRVVCPPASPSSKTGTPAGSVTTAGASGMVLSNNAKASFLFSSLDGAISGWNAALGMNLAVPLIAINNTSAGASYPGLAILNANATTSYILAPNFGTANTIEVYDQTFKPTKLSGSFTDPNLPAGYGPFSIHILNNQVWVAYAMRPAAAPFAPVTGAGNGIVDVFDNNGNFVARAVTGGNLNAPWGVAFAPSTGFGIFSGDLLIGNFGDGIINVYNPTTFAFLGQLTDATGKPLSFASLWEIVFGQSNSTPAGAGDPNTLYIAAGLTNEAHGLFAGIANITSSTAPAAFGFSASTSAATVTAGNSTMATISVTPTNSFSGNVNLSCSGPVGVTCTFSPSTLSVTPTAAATSTVTIQTAASMARLQKHAPWTRDSAVLTVAFLLPFGSLLVFTRRRAIGKSHPLQLLSLFALLVISAGVAVGCSSATNPAAAPVASTPPPTAPTTPPTPGTPAGLQMVTITASSGSITQNTTVALTVQ